MNKRWVQSIIIFSAIIIFLVLGYLFLKKQNQPDTPAFNDKFTRLFLVEDADTPEGFHLFESGTRKYTILIPENYIIAEGSYYRKKGIGSEFPDTENVYIDQVGISPKENGMIKGIKLFLKPDGNVIVDSRLSGMLRKINAPEETEIHQIKDENKTVYYAGNIDDYHEDDITDRYFYFYGFITDNHSDQALYVELEDTCFSLETRECEIDFEEEKKMGLEMMKSVEFK